MLFRSNHWINGKNVAGNDYFQTTNPATGEVLADVASGGEAEINQAVAAAKEAFPKWANLPMKERARLMRRLGDLIDQNVPEIAAMETADTGLPIHVVKKLNVYLRAARELTQKLDHEPSPEEIANLLEKPVGEVKRMLGLNERVTSVDVSLGPDTDKTLLDTLTDDRPTDPCELLLDDDLSNSIDQWLSDLSEKQREVVIRRFGLRGHEASTLEEVGQEIGLTRERDRLLHALYCVPHPGTGAP